MAARQDIRRGSRYILCSCCASNVWSRLILDQCRREHVIKYQRICDHFVMSTRLIIAIESEFNPMNDCFEQILRFRLVRSQRKVLLGTFQRAILCDVIVQG